MTEKPCCARENPIIPAVTISARDTGTPKSEAVRIMTAPVNSTETALRMHISVISFPTLSSTLPPKRIAPAPIATPAMTAPVFAFTTPRPTSGPTEFAELLAPAEKATNTPDSVIRTESILFMIPSE